MKIENKYQKLAQEILNRSGAGLKPDGFFGIMSDRAADRINGIQLPPERQVALTIQKEWNAARMLVGDIKPDGWWGPVTEEAANQLLGEHFVRPDENGAAPIQCHDGTCSLNRCWSPTQAQLIRHYGQPGTNQIMVSLPFPMVLDWDRSAVVTRTKVHKLVAPHFTAALEGARDHYGREAIEALGLNLYGGTLNVRKKRGGRTWSFHAFGAAHDFWPSANKLKETHRTARFAKAEYAPFFGFFEKQGYISLGRCFDFDWMHIERPPQ